MMFRDKSISKLYTFALAAVFAMTLAGCGGNGGGTAADDDDPAVTPTPQEMCEDEGGRWNADLTSCTTAEELEAERMAAVAAVTAEAGTMGDAIAAEVAQATDAGLGGTGATTYSIAFNRDREGTTITIADTNMAGDDDPKFMQDMALGDGTALVRDNGEGVEEVVIVRTDIEAPTATAFAEVADQALNVDTDAVAATFEALTVVVGKFAELQSAGFTAASGANVTELNLAHDDTGTTDVDEAFEIAGAYNGAMGTYRCNQTSGNCTVTVDADSKVTAVSAGWIFTPDEGVTSDVPDADYLHYGVWLQRTTTDGATTIDEVEVFSGSTIAASSGTDLDSVEGGASYEGGAVGVYVKDAYKSDGTLDSATSGAFTADASLMVLFGGDDVAVNLKNTVTGSISNFELSGGEDNAWSVALSGTRATGANVITGTANGGGTAGAFSGTFYGPGTPDDITGEFDASFSNGAVAGGFGASKQ